VDGNFSADHLKQKNPLDDMPSTNGEGMMSNQAQYKTYLAHPVRIPQVSLFRLASGTQHITHVALEPRRYDLFCNSLPAEHSPIQNLIGS